jgi:hypothetical protein
MAAIVTSEVLAAQLGVGCCSTAPGKHNCFSLAPQASSHTAAFSALLVCCSLHDTVRCCCCPENCTLAQFPTCSLAIAVFQQKDLNNSCYAAVEIPSRLAAAGRVLLRHQPGSAALSALAAAAHLAYGSPRLSASAIICSKEANSSSCRLQPTQRTDRTCTSVTECSGFVAQHASRLFHTIMQDWSYSWMISFGLLQD